VVPRDPCSDDDDDNSRSAATPLVEGTAASAQVCMGGQDIYAIELTQPVNDVTLVLTWTGVTDLDMYMYAEDGTYLGAGWFGNSREEWRATGLPPQTIYAWIDVFACGYDDQSQPVPCTDLKSY